MHRYSKVSLFIGVLIGGFINFSWDKIYFIGLFCKCSILTCTRIPYFLYLCIPAVSFGIEIAFLHVRRWNLRAYAGIHD
ncbi:hypothetical protein BACCAP_01412 [Pseudoflavonifractor capillosus ATCC 29799]|uniref:Uncharacterized protein n=1 Tax=Pseudoflavonifractor capillosus ATCC 29799 TaxID=411467 RepID=A6NT84_9FIRM|nr:hypothetical protein BACCAP_01412 [Pseudoflavonifractor capillosus ATCC 29799]